MTAANRNLQVDTDCFACGAVKADRPCRSYCDKGLRAVTTMLPLPASSGRIRSSMAVCVFEPQVVRRVVGPIPIQVIHFLLSGLAVPRVRDDAVHQELLLFDTCRLEVPARCQRPPHASARRAEHDPVHVHVIASPRLRFDTSKAGGHVNAPRPGRHGLPRDVRDVT